LKEPSKAPVPRISVAWQRFSALRPPRDVKCGVPMQQLYRLWPVNSGTVVPSYEMAIRATAEAGHEDGLRLGSARLSNAVWPAKTDGGSPEAFAAVSIHLLRAPAQAINGIGVHPRTRDRITPSDLSPCMATSRGIRSRRLVGAGQDLLSRPSTNHSQLLVNSNRRSHTPTDARGISQGVGIHRGRHGG
jgi:hypothetical protein